MDVCHIQINLRQYLVEVLCFKALAMQLAEWNETEIKRDEIMIYVAHVDHWSITMLLWGKLTEEYRHKFFSNFSFDRSRMLCFILFRTNRPLSILFVIQCSRNRFNISLHLLFYLFLSLLWWCWCCDWRAILFSFHKIPLSIYINIYIYSAFVRMNFVHDGFCQFQFWMRSDRVRLMFLNRFVDITAFISDTFI